METCAIGMRFYNCLLWFTREIYYPKGFKFKKLRILILFRISSFEFRICAEKFRIFQPKDSTKEFVRNFQLFLQNKPKFPLFSPKNDDLTKKRTQTNPISETQKLKLFRGKGALQWYLQFYTRNLSP